MIAERIGLGDNPDWRLVLTPAGERYHEKVALPRWGSEPERKTADLEIDGVMARLLLSAIREAQKKHQANWKEDGGHIAEDNCLYDLEQALKRIMEATR